MEMTPAMQEGTHKEHIFLLEELDRIERGLVNLQCYSEVFADLAAAQELDQESRKLATWLPIHFRREEKSVFEKAEQISPELEDFCRLMRSEHGDLLLRLRRLRASIIALEIGEGLYETVVRVKEEGKDFTLRMRKHINLEEEEFSGFL